MNLTPGPDPHLIVATALRRDADAHDAGAVDSVGESYDDVLAEVLPLWNEAGGTIGMAFRFWDAWVKARNNDWPNSSGIAREDWPRLARHIAAALEMHNTVSEPVLERFADRGLWARLRAVWDALH